MIRSQITPTSLAIHRGNFGHGKHLKAQVREMLNNAHQRCCFASAGTARQYDSLDIFHLVLSFLVAKVQKSLEFRVESLEKFVSLQQNNF